MPLLASHVPADRDVGQRRPPRGRPRGSRPGATAASSAAGLPIGGDRRRAGRTPRPAACTALPSHLMPVVVITRWPWIVIASAPPFHIALTTAWMSCWWTTSRLRSRLVELMTSAGRVGERDREAGAGARASARPGPSSSSTCRWSLRDLAVADPRRSAARRRRSARWTRASQRLVLPVLAPYERRRGRCSDPGAGRCPRCWRRWSRTAPRRRVTHQRGRRAASRRSRRSRHPARSPVPGSGLAWDPRSWRLR